MKIKKVEIQAFKSYLYREDGTFDFTRFDDATQPANFISIYAPNGFGKTSFYDAIDYCMTNNIGRYIRAKVQGMNQKEAKTHNQQGEKQYILRNRAADSVEKERKIKLGTQISVFTTSDIEPVHSQYKPPIRGSMDYKFDPKAARVGSDYFESVLVSQEAIDTFLREDNPVERYNKFIDKSHNSGLARANSNRSIINIMLKDIDLAANKEIEKRDKAQAEIGKLEIPKDLFTDVNKVVSSLNDTGVVINALTSEFTREDKLRLDNKAVLERAATQQMLELHRNNCDAIDLFLLNSEKLQCDYSDKKQLEAQIELLFATINQKQTLATQYSKLNSNQKNASDLRQYIEQLNGFIAQTPMLIAHKAELVTAIKKSNLLEEKLGRLIVSTRNEIKALVTDRAALQKQVFANQSLDSLRAKMTGYYQQIAKLQKQIERDKLRVEVEEEIQFDCNSAIEEKRYLQMQLEAVDISNPINFHLEVASGGKLKSIYQQYEDADKRILQLKHQQTIAEKNLKNTELQSRAITALIEQSMAIITASQQSNCPLCNQAYGDIEALQKAIASNPALSVAAQKYTKELNQIKNKVEFTRAELGVFRHSYYGIC
ncbi:MAG: hypothetical protein HRT35_11570 [Algicola sp.]|nr:hypothetical protein [Algicola sp.]